MFSPADAAGWVKELSGVYGPQANIWFELGKAEPLPLAGLSEVVSDADGKVLEQKKDGALINIFLAGARSSPAKPIFRSASTWSRRS